MPVSEYVGYSRKKLESAFDDLKSKNAFYVKENQDLTEKLGEVETMCLVQETEIEHLKRRNEMFLCKTHMKDVNWCGLGRLDLIDLVKNKDMALEKVTDHAEKLKNYQSELLIEKADQMKELTLLKDQNNTAMIKLDELTDDIKDHKATIDLYIAENNELKARNSVLNLDDDDSDENTTADKIENLERELRLEIRKSWRLTQELKEATTMYENKKRECYGYVEAIKNVDDSWKEKYNLLINYSTNCQKLTEKQNSELIDLNSAYKSENADLHQHLDHILWTCAKLESDLQRSRRPCCDNAQIDCKNCGFGTGKTTFGNTSIDQIEIVDDSDDELVTISQGVNMEKNLG
jgi:hypothetical protein